MASSPPVQRLPERENSPSRSTRSLGTARSFTRLESQPPVVRSRSTTLTSSTTPDRSLPFGTFLEPNVAYELDESEPPNLDRSEHRQDPDRYVSEESFPQPDLPAEVLDMTDSFIESLSARVHPAPVSIDSLGSMFQDFYDTSAATISAHVSKFYGSDDAHGSHQPLVPMSEIVQRKKDRKRRDTLRVALQEVVEKRVTEAVFDKIWRHYGAEDEARDEALRSKTMALAVVGIGLKELGLEENINVMDLQPICEALQNLNGTKCPHGKLQLLKRAHKAIVDVLTSVVPFSTSSADHILPILIYSLIISPPHIHVVSNLLFIQRFRYHRMLDGEAAYCLTNLEAAISFLETVDMGTLTASESRIIPSAEVESRGTPASLLPISPEMVGETVVPTAVPAVVSASFITASSRLETGAQKDNSPISSVAGSTRRMTYLTPVEFATSAATSAVNTADQSLKTIGNSLENSYRFLFGKLSDKRTDLPKTLEDVRKLVGTPPQEQGPLKESANDERLYSNDLNKENPHGSGVLVTSMRRVGSVDNNRNDAVDAVPKTTLGPEASEILNVSESHLHSASGPAYLPVADSVRNIGSHLGRFAGNINVIRTFSRSQMSKTPPPDPSTTGVDSPVARPDQTMAKVEPPISKFLEVEAAELRIGDVGVLLHDYRRLAAALKSAGAF